MKKNYIKYFISILLIVGITWFVFNSIYFQEGILHYLYKKDYSEYVEKYAIKYNVDENLVYAVIKNESNFKADSVSKSDAKGLMQIIDNTVKDVVEGINEMDYNTIDVFDPETNIHLGVNYLSMLLDKYNNNVGLAVAAYNAGIGNVDKWIENSTINDEGTDLENIPFKETNIYVRKVLRDYDIFKKL